MLTRIQEAQQEIVRWVTETFGRPFLYNKKERCQRFVEEALELVQSVGMTRDEAMQVLDYVYNRPVELNISTEVGGAFTTLCALASCIHEDVDLCYLVDHKKRWEKQGHIRQKQNIKADKGVGSRVQG